ncbi:hypothetical protein RM844_04130 [Streptomyces sp. DSM 44915]|uniref:Integral membrane protein n=1 Tax=Streptomyces chisholmiae TaxID=3075540 RepID=A0ABU2JMK3_9ACTN|nr:hypothetical protein [Streptomyces sp. DSM 44915]MDT0265478.1 hypothetical protein [Streptomyces sp. DSM 44915]
MRALLVAHRQLCVRAVDPLELAAGLEAGGVDERTVARCRHRDVFSLAEELHARTPRPAVEPAGAAAPPARGLARLALPLLPGVVCAGGLWLVAGLPPQAAPGRAALALVTGVVTLLAVLLVLARQAPPGPAGLLALPPVGYALVGDGVLGELLVGSQRETGSAAGAALLLAFSVAPIAWCRDGFAGRARRLLGRRRLREFTRGARMLLLRTGLLLALGLAGVLAASRLVPVDWAPLGWPGALATTALAALLGLAALLCRHGHRGLAARGLALTGGLELVALALASAAWLPGLGGVARPVGWLTEAHGPAAVPLVAAAVGGCWLLAGVAVVLPRATAHRAGPAPRGRPAGPRGPVLRSFPSPFSAPATPGAPAEPFTREEHHKR